MRALSLTPSDRRDARPDLVMVDAPQPEPRPGEVLVRVHYAGLSYLSYEAWNGERNKALKKARKNNTVVSGIEMAGIAESDGEVIKKGDRVFGYTNIFKGPWFHAEYVAISEHAITKIPEPTTMQGAVSIVGGALTALKAIEGIAKLSAEQSVLITGATGSVGTTAVQLAKHIGAKITAICHSSQLDLARELGAAHVLSYDKDELPSDSQKFDLVFDAAASLSFKRASSLLNQRGCYITTMPHHDLAGFARSLLSSRKWGFLLVHDTDAPRMNRLRQLMGDGIFQETVDRVFPANAAVEAFDYQQGTGKRGKILLDFRS